MGIKLFAGNIGSGKTISMVRSILERKQKALVNFDVRCPYTERLLIEHFVTKKEVLQGKRIVRKNIVNWDYWNEMIQKKEPFDIYIDEMHNIVSSRRSMATFSVLFLQWVSQVRKVLGTSEQNHFYICTQRINRIDVGVRDLITEIIYCNKHYTGNRRHTVCLQNRRKTMKWLPEVVISRVYFKGEDCMDRYYEYLFKPNRKLHDGRDQFIANDLFKFYDSYALVRFGEELYL